VSVLKTSNLGLPWEARATGSETATSGVIGRSERYVMDDDRRGIALFATRFDGFSDVIGMVASTHLTPRASALL
jgi:hypothetical protein